MNVLGTGVTLVDAPTLATDFGTAVYPYIEPALLIVFGLAGIAWFCRKLKANRGL